MSKPKTQSEMAAHLAGLFRSTLPPLLAGAGLKSIDEYASGGLPIQADKRQLHIVPASGEWTREIRKEVFYVQILLPGEGRPDKYLSVIWPALRRIVAPDELGMMTLEIEYQLHYPGEPMGQINATIIELTLTYEMPLDDEE